MAVGDGEGEVKVVNSVRGVDDYPIETGSVDVAFEVFECFMTFSGASPIPYAKAVIDVPGPVKQELLVLVAQLLFVIIEEQCSPHTGWGGTHCCALLL